MYNNNVKIRKSKRYWHMGIFCAALPYSWTECKILLIPIISATTFQYLRKNKKICNFSSFNIQTIKWNLEFLHSNFIVIQFILGNCYRVHRYFCTWRSVFAEPNFTNTSFVSTKQHRRKILGVPILFWTLCQKTTRL